MALIVTVETGALIANANSYVSTLTIDAWVLTNPHDSTWSALTQAKKDGYAVMSCRVLNEQMDWDGWQTSKTQSLDLPRSGMVDKNGNPIDAYEIPGEVQDAQCELARLLAIEDRTADSGTSGFKEISVGSIKLVIDRTDRPVVMPPAVWNMVKPFGIKATSKGTATTVRI